MCKASIRSILDHLEIEVYKSILCNLHLSVAHSQSGTVKIVTPNYKSFTLALYIIKPFESQALNFSELIGG